MKVLILAESCNPLWESVPLVGWSHYHAVSQVVDTHLVTRTWNRDGLLQAGLREGRDFTLIDTEPLFSPVARLVERISGPNKGYAMLTALTLPSYLAFEHLAWRRLGTDIRAGRFDIVHRITPVSPATPSPLARHCRRAGVPFVLGPLNGGLPWPAEFPELRRQEREWLSRLRGAHRLVPGYRATRDSASAIIVGSAGALADLPPRWHGKSIYMPENAVDPSRFPDTPPRQPGDYAGRPLRAVFLGRLVPFKGADMALDAAAPLLRDGRLTLSVLGFGPEQDALEAQAARLGVTDQVRFHGKVPHPEVGALLRGADLLLSPSVREFGGGVVLEAMAMGVVPVVVSFGGPAELISPSSGIGLRMQPRAGVVADMQATLDRLASDPGQLAAMSRAAVRRIRRWFTWPAKAQQMLEVYRWVLGQRPGKPDFGLPFPDSGD